jgi:D-beta-D-heptose 7-phosphate kinase/D-beta-D-heptose 1-phosphate adenosyltransferase
LRDAGVDVSGLLVEEHFSTQIKNRFVAGSQQMLRVDFEKIIPLSSALEAHFIASLPALLQGVDLVAICDYAKGILTPTLLRALIQEAKERKIPVIVDPKGRDFSRYRGASVLKPNLSEAYEAASLDHKTPLSKVAEKLMRETAAEALLVTRSEEGISLFFEDKQEDYPAKIREVRDVTGAGDTVLAVVACALANGLSLGQAAELANLAAGLAVQRFGCARIDLSELARALLEHDASNKVFESRHLFALKSALRGRSYSVLALHVKTQLSHEIFVKMRKLKEDPTDELIVFVEEGELGEDLVSLLTSLSEVDFILLCKESLYELVRSFPPKQFANFSSDGQIELKDMARFLDQRIASTSALI